MTATVRHLPGVFALLCLLVATAAIAADLDESGVADAIADYTQGRFDLARRQFEVAASAGSAAAQYHLGLMHARGEGTTPDLVAASWWKARERQPMIQGRRTPRSPGDAAMKTVARSTA